MKRWGDPVPAAAVEPILAKLRQHYHQLGGEWYAEVGGDLYALEPHVRFGPPLPLTAEDRAAGVAERRTADLLCWTRLYDVRERMWGAAEPYWPGVENTRAFTVRRLRDGTWDATPQEGEEFDETPCPDPDAWIARRTKAGAKSE